MVYQYQRVVRFGDTDAAGVVYFANFLPIFHEAYEDSLGKSGINLKRFFSQESHIIIPITHAEVSFLQPVFCGDLVIVEFITQSLTENAFAINYQVFAVEKTGKPAVVGQTRHVCIDSTTRSRHPLPVEVQRWLESFSCE